MKSTGLAESLRLHVNGLDPFTGSFLIVSTNATHKLVTRVSGRPRSQVLLPCKSFRRTPRHFYVEIRLARNAENEQIVYHTDKAEKPDY